MMRIRKTAKVVVIASLLMCLAIIAFAGEVTLVGEVNDNYQFYCDGQYYEVADTPEGNDMVSNYISAKVEVVGTVEDKDDMKIITVKRFRVVPE